MSFTPGDVNDVADRLLEANISGASSTVESERFTAGRATFVMDNTDGRFSPDYQGGIYYGRVDLMTRVNYSISQLGVPIHTFDQQLNSGPWQVAITDDVRGLSVEGDGRSVSDGTVGFMPNVTPLVTNANFASSTAGWVKLGEAQLDSFPTKRNDSANVSGKFANVSGRVRCNGVATGEGFELSPRVAVTAGVTYSLTSHVNAPAAATLRAVIEWWNALSGGATVGSTTTKTVVADGTWQETFATAKAPVGATHAVVRYETITTAQAITFRVGGIVLCDSYDPVAYRESNWFVPTVRINPLNIGNTKTDGALIMRFRSRINVANYDTTFDHYLWRWTLTGGEMRLRYIAGVGTGTLQFDRFDGAAVTGVQSTLALARGDWVTVILKWNATTLFMSVNGANFTSVANALVAGTINLGWDIGNNSLSTVGANVDVSAFYMGDGSAATAMTNAVALATHNCLAASRDPYLFKDIPTTGWQLMLWTPSGRLLSLNGTAWIFDGYVDSIEETWSDKYRLDVAVIGATDGFLKLGGSNLTASLVHTTAYQQMQEVLDQVVSDSVIGTEYTPETAAVAALTVAAADEVNSLGRIQQIAQDAEIWFFYNPIGEFTAISRFGRLTKPLVAVIGDGDGIEISYERLGRSLDDDLIFNDAKITPSGGALQQYTHPQSIGRYGRRTYSSTASLLTSAALVLQVAGRIVSRFAQPKTRIRSVAVRPLTSSWAWGLLTVKIGDRVRVIRRASNGLLLSEDLYVTGTRVDDRGPAANVVLELSFTESGAVGEFWILEDATYGKLGTTTRVG